MKDYEELDQRADPILLLLTPGDPGVLDPGPVQGEVIRVERHHDPARRRGERQLLQVGQAAPARLLGRQYVNARRADPARDRPGVMLVHVVTDRLSHPASPSSPAGSA